jgi:hypothetical protein
MLMLVVPQAAALLKYPWFHGDLTQDDAERLLNKQKVALCSSLVSHCTQRGAIFVKEEGFWLIRFGKNGNFGTCHRCLTGLLSPAVFSAKVDGFKHLEIKNATGVLKIGGKHYNSWEDVLAFVKKGMNRSSLTVKLVSLVAEYKVSLKNFVPTTRYEGLFQAPK